MSAQVIKNKYEMDMCSGPLMKKLVSFSVPLIISSNLQLLFNAVDIIVVGRFTGSQALAAVGSTTALINLVIMFLSGISLGSGVLAGRFFASKNKEGMENIVHTSMAFSLLSGIILSLAGMLASKPALMLMDTPEGVYEQALLYIRVYFLGLPFFMLYTYGAAILRAVGDTKRPLAFLVFAGIFNAGLNMILVIVFHLGVLGVAAATVLSEAISCVLVLRVLRNASESYHLDFKKMKINKYYLFEIFKIGLPAGIQSLVINFSNVLLQSSVNSLGETAIAGYTAANNVFGFLYVTCNSVTQACMSFVSQNYGIRNLDRIKLVIRDCMILSVGVMLVSGFGTYFFGEEILGIYTSGNDVVKCGMDIFLYTTTTYFIFGIMDLFPGAMRGLGFSTVPMMISAIGTVGTRIFWIYCVFPKYHTLSALFLTYPVSWVATSLVHAVYFYYIWTKKVEI